MNYHKYDTHVHTSETSICGKVDAKTLVRLYKKAGYTGVVITDHYSREFSKQQRMTIGIKGGRIFNGLFTAFEGVKGWGLKSF